ncbi:MAG: hypothetical protein JSS86_14075 [Cyanobacteria bacterium SZAS LIN-2]|nr:hypothetical protein [Cyanobacteria bacterium SZAS LIN-2]
MHALTVLFVLIGIAVGWKAGWFVAGFGEMYYGERVSYGVRRLLTIIIRTGVVVAFAVAAFFLSRV